jgi:hypothetical protein
MAREILSKRNFFDFESLMKLLKEERFQMKDFPLILPNLHNIYKNVGKFQECISK